MIRARVCVRIAVSIALATMASATVSCAPLPHSKSAGGVGNLALRPVAWNAANASVGKVRAVADAGDVVCVFADEGATVLSATAVVARDEAARGFRFGGSVLASDGQTRWIVGIDPKGKLWRLRGMTAFEDVGARYGLEGKGFRAATLLDAGTVGFAFDREIAIARAQKTSLYPAGTFVSFAGGGGYAAGVTSESIDLVNATNGAVTRFALPGATAAALDGKGRLFATTKRGVYAAGVDGSLALVFDAGKDAIHGLAVAGERVWFADGAELGVVDGDRVSETTGAGIARDATLQGSPSGDVWVIGDGRLARFASLGDAGGDGAGRPGAAAGTGTTTGTRAAPGTAGQAWGALIAPVFARACAKCHQANGISGTDLSNERAWAAKRALIRERVLVQKTMPPDPKSLGDADRAAIEAWVAK